MNYPEVQAYQNPLREKVLLVGETLSGARFRIKSISYKGGRLTVTFNDGTLCKPEMLQSITGFRDIKQAQSFLLGKTV